MNEQRRAKRRTERREKRRTMTRFYVVLPWIIIFLLLLLAACAGETEPTAPAVTPSAAPSTAPTVESASDDQVSIRESSVTWETYQYELTEDDGIVPGSYDGRTKSDQHYKSWILENEYLQVTLVPEMGGRILSIVYKPTGHEALYQNPVGVPYQIDTGVFYYDWLMVYGGIFPTFPEPEHGKTWLQPWTLEVVSESDEEVVVAMSFTDDIDNPNAPRQYDLGPTGLEATYTVSLASGRTAVDTTLTLSNPADESVRYEYWTNATLAPGSDPLDPQTTAGAEIIAPVDMVKIPGYWREIAAQEDGAGLIDVYEFDNLRRFENWSEMGIAYAFPDMMGQNFWGVINHDNGEGIFRIADNIRTPGLKLWTWGYPHSTSVDPQATADEARPYIELWAGVTREFWQRTELAPHERLEIEETYSPSVGLESVTHANDDFLVNLAPTGQTDIGCQLFALHPEQTVVISMAVDGADFYQETVSLDPARGNDCSTMIPDTLTGQTLTLRVTDEKGAILFEGDAELTPDQ
ncbi:MAG: DUF5107 domain-containing protein [Chloroflexota bacterium]